MLVLGLIESAIELVPEKLTTDPSVVMSAQLRGKPTAQILLDESLHSKVINSLPESEKRGRPDVVHRCLLVALDSVLAKAQRLEVFVHTITGEIIEIAAGTRLPRRTQRFVGLIEQLLLHKRVPLQGDPLLQVVPGNLETYLKSLKPNQTFLLSVEGTPMSPTRLAQILVKETKPVLLVGGFAHGEVHPRVLEFVDQQVSIDPELLPASTIVGMAVHNVEAVLDLSTRRFDDAK
jgi:rRNA small subunit pseudouridine methyltransferase Nep1